MSGSREIISVLKNSKFIGIASHINPDGDSVGSLLALGMVLERQGKRAYASIPDPGSYPPQYRFLPGQHLLSAPQDFPEKLDLFLALDCSNSDRLGSLRDIAKRATVLVNIDHHEDNTRYGSFNLVNKKASSTAELVYDLIEKAKWEINPDVATCLYTGIVTDTGRFQHRNTTTETFILASRLVKSGADIFGVVKEVYENQSLAYTRLLGRALQRAEILEEQDLIYSYVTLEDLKETGAVLPETEDLIDYLRAVRGTRIVALFKEMEDGKVRVSLRSRDGFEVGPVARGMGGGGHAMAAGYTSDLDINASIETLVGVLRDVR
jgi:bifunctional oligoribonuclease and PAP phosphatase NrnA